MKKVLIFALLTTSTAFAGKIPFCEITFSGTTEGNGIKRPMHQSFSEKAVSFSYHFENIVVRASFANLDLKTGLILITDKMTGNVLIETYGAIPENEFGTLQSYLMIQSKDGSALGSTYQVTCKEVEEQDPADAIPAQTPPRADDYR